MILFLNRFVAIIMRVRFNVATGIVGEWRMKNDVECSRSSLDSHKDGSNIDWRTPVPLLICHLFKAIAKSFPAMLSNAISISSLPLTPSNLSLTHPPKQKLG